MKMPRMTIVHLEPVFECIAAAAVRYQKCMFLHPMLRIRAKRQHISQCNNVWVSSLW